MSHPSSTASLSKEHERPTGRRRSPTVKEPLSDRGLQAGLVVVLVIFAISIIYPLVYVVSASFSDSDAVRAGEVVLFPVGFGLEAYQALFDSPLLLRSFLNSLGYAAAVILLGTAVTMMAGYALSRQDLPFRRALTFLIMLTMLFNGGMIPTYLLVKSLNLLNTPLAMVLPAAVSVWQLIITKAFFETTIPHELLESSRMDGANDLTFFFRIALPLSIPILAVNMLLYGVSTWNAYFNGLIYLTDETLYPLQLAMRNILVQNTFDAAKLAEADPQKIAQMQQVAAKLKFALIVVSSIPPLIAYPFVQKHFVKGMMLGSVKG